jgi:hypothetical protein
MSLHLPAAAAAFSLVIASPAFADCAQDLDMLKQSVVSAETGASTDKSGMPVTKHQEEVLPGKQSSSGETTGATSKQIQAISPHQQEVTGGATGHGADQIAQMMTEAGKLAKAGDEAGCMRKLSEMKKLLGKD